MQMLFKNALFKKMLFKKHDILKYVIYCSNVKLFCVIYPQKETVQDSSASASTLVWWLSHDS